MTQTLLFAHDMFVVFASGWGDLAQLHSVHLSWLSGPIMSGISTFQSHQSFSTPAKMCASSWLCCAAGLCLSGLHLISLKGTMVYHRCCKFQTFLHHDSSLVWITMGAAVCYSGDIFYCSRCPGSHCRWLYKAPSCITCVRPCKFPLIETICITLTITQDMAGRKCALRYYYSSVYDLLCKLRKLQEVQLYTNHTHHHWIAVA